MTHGEMARSYVVLGAITKNALRLALVASLLVAAFGVLPWLQFPQFRMSREQTHLILGIGDGYLLLALGSLSAVEMAWLLIAGRLNATAIIVLLGASSLAIAVAGTSLASSAGFSCSTGASGQLGFLNIGCFFETGYVFSYEWGPVYATEFLWVAVGLSLFIGLTALCLPALERSRRDHATGFSFPSDLGRQWVTLTRIAKIVTREARAVLEYFTPGSPPDTNG